MPTGDAIFRGGMKSQRPQSRCGNRPGTGKSMESSAYSNEELPPRPSSRYRPTSSASLDDATWGRPLSRNMVQSRDVSMEDNFGQTENSAEVVRHPTPPSRPPSRPRSRRHRPLSSKGRSRSFDISGQDSNKTPLPHPLHKQSSFSKYTPLPSIGSAAVVESDGVNTTVISDETPNMPGNQIDNLSQNLSDFQLHQLPSEPGEDDPTRLKLAVRLLDGSRHERWFRKSDTMADVLAFAQTCSGGSLPLCQFCTGEVPRKEFKDMSLTIEAAGILSRSLLNLEEL